jgi:hypothetical protein
VAHDDDVGVRGGLDRGERSARARGALTYLISWAASAWTA